MKVTAEDYMKMPHEALIDKANSSSLESEIPFITAVLAAQASKDQARTSKRMFIVSIVSLFIALCSVVVSWAQTNNEKGNNEELEHRVKSLELKNIDLNTKLSQLETLDVETSIKGKNNE